MATVGEDASRGDGAPAWVDASGDGVRDEVLAPALESFRNYLLRVAERSLDPELACKIGASDLVQDTFLAAREHVAQFRGRSQAEWRGWLEAILRNRLANLRRHYRGTGKRRLDRELSPGSGAAVEMVADGAISTASRHAMRLEREAALLGALSRLPEHYRLVVRWHHEDRLDFEQIAARLETSAEAARKIWGRALVKLRATLDPSHDPR